MGPGAVMSVYMQGARVERGTCAHMSTKSCVERERERERERAPWRARAFTPVLG